MASNKPSVILALLPGADLIAERLLAKADIELLVVHEAAHQMLTEQNIPSRLLESFLTDEERQCTLDEATRRAIHVAEKVHDDSFWKLLIAPLANRYEASAWPKLRDALLNLLSRSLYREITLIDAVHRCADQTLLRLVIVPHDICRDTRTLIHAAHQRGAPALHLAHGVPGGSQIPSTLDGALCADMVAVFNQDMKSVYESFGMPPHRVVVTGNPQWDVHTRPLAPGFREGACRQLPGLDPNKPIIVYALTFGHQFSATGVKTFHFGEQITDALLPVFADLARRHSDWQFVFRPHPNVRTALEILSDKAHKAGLHEFWIDAVTGSVASVAMADVMVCIESNIGIEAVLAGKPVVNCLFKDCCGNFFNEGLGTLFHPDDAVVTVPNPSEAGHAIEQALLDKNIQHDFIKRRPQTMQRFNDLCDGKATERFCEWAIQLIANPAPILNSYSDTR